MDIDKSAPGNQSQQPVTRTTDNETGHDFRRNPPEVPLFPDDEAPLDIYLSDVRVDTEVPHHYPGARKGGPVDPLISSSGESEKEPRNMPASDPESGA